MPISRSPGPPRLTPEHLHLRQVVQRKCLLRSIVIRGSTLCENLEASHQMPEGGYKAVAAVATPLRARCSLSGGVWAVTHRKQNCKNGSQSRGYRAAFTLVELSVTMGVLVLLVLLFTQLFNSAATVTILGYKKMDADSEARQVLDRMTFDFAQMVKRSDVDYFLKASGTASDCGACGPQTGGNDQAAFFSTVPGYYPTPTAIPVASPIGPSPVSLVSYRINSDSSPSASAFYNRMQRM